MINSGNVKTDTKEQKSEKLCQNASINGCAAKKEGIAGNAAADDGNVLAFLQTEFLAQSVAAERIVAREDVSFVQTGIGKELLGMRGHGIAAPEASRGRDGIKRFGCGGEVKVGVDVGLIEMVTS